jgi:hypothetical protein
VRRPPFMVSINLRQKSPMISIRGSDDLNPLQLCMENQI